MAAANDVKPRSLHSSTRFFRFPTTSFFTTSTFSVVVVAVDDDDVSGGVTKRTSSMAWTTPLPAVTSLSVTVALPNITLPGMRRKL